MMNTVTTTGEGVEDKRSLEGDKVLVRSTTGGGTVNQKKTDSRALTRDQVHLKIGIGEVAGEVEISRGETPECHPRQGHNEVKTPETAHHRVVGEIPGVIPQQVSTIAEPVPL